MSMIHLLLGRTQWGTALGTQDAQDMGFGSRLCVTHHHTPLGSVSM